MSKRKPLWCTYITNKGLGSLVPVKAPYNDSGFYRGYHLKTNDGFLHIERGTSVYSGLIAFSSYSKKEVQMFILGVQSGFDIIKDIVSVDKISKTKRTRSIKKG